MKRDIIKKRIAMKTYIENDDLLPVYKMVVSDDKSGLLLLNALIENTFDYGFKYLTTPEPEEAEGSDIPGVSLVLPDSSEDILLVLTYTIDRTITVICNDESRAKEQFEEVIVKPADSCGSQGVSFIKQAGLIALILNIVMMIVGFYVAKFFTSGVAQQRCISLECGLQNGTLAVFVSTQLFDEMVYIVPTAAYALVMMATSLFFVFIVKKSS